MGNRHEKFAEPPHHESTEKDHVDDLQEQRLQSMEGRKLRFTF